MNIYSPQTFAQPDWLELRMALWPHASIESHQNEMMQLVSDQCRFGQFIARDEQHAAIGLIEVSVRSDYVNGTISSPVAFLEGIYVKPSSRGNGVARALVDVAMRWASAKGCSEFASDTSIENRISQEMHIRLGFVETERVVYFKRKIE
ncbi:aminoglycoside 6'-N-acetyltransferase [Comamonas sp. B21-038]|uniref:aminoglycoside 6'-N-acetyltransferase n=1 Tax=Comamonas sp. B21-038 TaxID=2918299 RepID=UPI001EFB9BBF|nr:aminoglycoside 6'-N-acetyltransferase [Comamonas sp. B21-038]ULR88030.1 GNAT family N-acetyltransferase [Comamonas sp. B21-038]